MSLIKRTQPPVGHVHLVLYPCQPQQPNSHPEHEFYLEIPISFIQKHFRSHLKFLLYLGWCVLGIYGDLLNDRYEQVDQDGELLERGTYHYYTKETVDIFKHAVDVETIKTLSQHNSSDASTRDTSFRKELLRRDAVCVFTGANDLVNGMHIIPCRKGNEWIQYIVSNRPNDEPTPSMNIDSIQNGLICIPQIHTRFDSRLALILKTPNAILNENDVEHCQRPFSIPDGHSYPSDSRYTFQHIDMPSAEVCQYLMTDNGDATFLTSSGLPKPSSLLLNYNYGATAVKRWGRNVSILSGRVFRPKVPAPAKTSGQVDCGKSAKKRRRFGTGEKGEGEIGEGEVELGEGVCEGASGDDEVTQEWDEDDVMLFLWGNSKAARKRREAEQQDRNMNIENWRSSAAVD